MWPATNRRSTYEKGWRNHWHHDVCRVIRDPEESGLAQEGLVLSHEIADLDLTLKMSHVTLSVRNLEIVWNSTPNEVLKRRGFGCRSSNIDSLIGLDCNSLIRALRGEACPEIGHTKNCPRSLV